MDKPKDRTAAANLNVIRVRAEAKDRQRTIPFQIQLQIDHELLGQALSQAVEGPQGPTAGLESQKVHARLLSLRS